MFVGVWVVGEFFGLFVPLEFLVCFVGDVGEVGDVAGLVAFFYVGDGFLAGAGAVEEVL